MKCDKSSATTRRYRHWFIYPHNISWDSINSLTNFSVVGISEIILCCWIGHPQKRASSHFFFIIIISIFITWRFIVDDVDANIRQWAENYMSIIIIIFKLYRRVVILCPTRNTWDITTMYTCILYMVGAGYKGPLE